MSQDFIRGQTTTDMGQVYRVSLEKQPHMSSHQTTTRTKLHMTTSLTSLLLLHLFCHYMCHQLHITRDRRVLV